MVSWSKVGQNWMCRPCNWLFQLTYFPYHLKWSVLAGVGATISLVLAFCGEIATINHLNHYNDSQFHSNRPLGIPLQDSHSLYLEYMWKINRLIFSKPSKWPDEYDSYLSFWQYWYSICGFCNICLRTWLAFVLVLITTTYAIYELCFRLPYDSVC